MCSPFYITLASWDWGGNGHVVPINPGLPCKVSRTLVLSNLHSLLDNRGVRKACEMIDLVSNFKVMST
jgi:hypothetical protein